MINLLKELKNKDTWMIDNLDRPYTVFIVSGSLMRKVTVDIVEKGQPYQIEVTIMDIRGGAYMPLSKEFSTTGKELCDAIKDIKYRIVESKEGIIDA